VTTIIERLRSQRRADSIARMRAFLAAHPPPGAERVILFGSLARGDFDGASDADLLVIGGEGRIDTGIWDAAGRDCDIIPWTREAWARGLANGHPFALAVAREGVELWSADQGRAAGGSTGSGAG
jgi:Nucleotidyltransferase domain